VSHARKFTETASPFPPVPITSFTAFHSIHLFCVITCIPDAATERKMQIWVIVYNRCVARVCSKSARNWLTPSPSNSTQITDGCGVGQLWQLLCFRCTQATTAETVINITCVKRLWVFSYSIARRYRWKLEVCPNASARHVSMCTFARTHKRADGS